MNKSLLRFPRVGHTNFCLKAKYEPRMSQVLKTMHWKWTPLREWVNLWQAFFQVIGTTEESVHQHVSTNWFSVFIICCFHWIGPFPETHPCSTVTKVIVGGSKKPLIKKLGLYMKAWGYGKQTKPSFSVHGFKQFRWFLAKNKSLWKRLLPPLPFKQRASGKVRWCKSLVCNSPGRLLKSCKAAWAHQNLI